MKISFYKGCFSRSLTIETETKSLHLRSDLPNTESEWNSNLPFLKQILNKLVNELKERDSLSTVYRYYVESEYGEINYEVAVQESKEVVFERVTKYVNDYDLNKESYSLSEFLHLYEEVLSAFNKDEDTHSDCDQCDDTNYGYEVELND
jgi:hypothetical protein